MIERRTFLKLASAVGLAKYSEPVVARLVEPARHQWIEDKGDYIIVRVPECKTFANETLLKPAILLLGSGSIVSRITSKSYVNALFEPGSVMKECLLDGRHMTTEEPRAVMMVAGSGFDILDLEGHVCDQPLLHLTSTCHHAVVDGLLVHIGQTLTINYPPILVAAGFKSA